MIGLELLPTEIFDLVIEHLVVIIGIQKAVLLRTVSQGFNAAIIHAICIAQVIDMDDSATPDLSARMEPSLRGSIIATKLRAPGHANGSQMALSVVAKVSSMLESMTGNTDPAEAKSRCESIAAAVNIECNAPVDAQIEAQNLLRGAVIIGNMSVLALLIADNCSLPLSASIDLNGSTPYFHDCLTLASARGHYAVVEHLLECGARIDSIVCHWRRPHDHENINGLADWRNHSKTVRSWALSSEPPSALRVAVQRGHEQICHLLLQPQHRFDTNSVEYLRAIVAGACSGHMNLIQVLFKLIKKDVSDFDHLGSEMLWAAVRHNRVEVVQWLLDKGVDVNAFPWSPYGEPTGAAEIAACTGNIIMLRFLIERGARVNVSPWSWSGPVPIQAASQCGQEEAVELLLEHGADPTKALKRAAFGGQIRLIRTLLGRFPDLPFRENGDVGRSAMLHALMAGNLAIITALVEGGVSLNDNYECPSRQPLIVARSYRRPWVVGHLKSLGARDNNEEIVASRCIEESRGVLISERTWQWVSRY